MHIRLANISDRAGLAKVQVDSYRIAYRGLLPDDYLDQFTYEEETRDWMNLLSAADHEGCMWPLVMTIISWAMRWAGH